MVSYEAHRQYRWMLYLKNRASGTMPKLVVKEIEEPTRDKQNAEQGTARDLQTPED